MLSPRSISNFERKFLIFKTDTRLDLGLALKNVVSLHGCGPVGEGAIAVTQYRPPELVEMASIREEKDLQDAVNVNARFFIGKPKDGLKGFSMVRAKPDRHGGTRRFPGKKYHMV